jgi:hypothetical protein
MIKMAAAIAALMVFVAVAAFQAGRVVQPAEILSSLAGIDAAVTQLHT